MLSPVPSQNMFAMSVLSILFHFMFPAPQIPIACLKLFSGECKMYATICRRLAPKERRITWIRRKYHAKWSAQMSGMNVQTRSNTQNFYYLLFCINYNGLTTSKIFSRLWTAADRISLFIILLLPSFANLWFVKKVKNISLPKHIKLISAKNWPNQCKNIIAEKFIMPYT